MQICIIIKFNIFYWKNIFIKINTNSYIKYASFQYS